MRLRISKLCLLTLTFLFIVIICHLVGTEGDVVKIEKMYEVDCNNLQMAQYMCAEPEIDNLTQQPKGCTSENRAKINCSLADRMVCKGTDNSTTFEMEIPCKYTNGYSFEVALILSVFLGMFGIDRFYLGYPAIGLLKLSTLGFMFLGQLVDIILIATQVVGPADGSYYVISYYGPVVSVLHMNNETYKVHHTVW